MQGLFCLTRIGLSVFFLLDRVITPSSTQDWDLNPVRNVLRCQLALNITERFAYPWQLPNHVLLRLNNHCIIN